MTTPIPLRKSASVHAASDTHVIIGAGQAGAQAAFTMRESGFRGRIVLLGEESQLPYMRPPLSKKFLGGAVHAERLLLRPLDFYGSAGIELRLGIRALAIEPRAGVVHLEGGERLAYGKLLFATGTRARRIDVPGSRLPGIHYLRTMQDALLLRAAIVPGTRLAIVGGGYVGLEVAATAAVAGARVTVLEAGDRVLGRVTTPGISDFLAGVHRSRGVEIRCGARVAAFAGTDRLEAVLCGDAQAALPADIAVIGIGAEPNVELAMAAGLACGNGIVVDDRCRTSSPNIYAAGDCAAHPNPLLDRRLRLESVQNAVDQAAVAARNMCGEERRYAKVPWFWSQQYEFKLQSAGVLDGYDEVVERGDRASGSFALTYLKGGEVVACDAVNLAGEYFAARRRIEARLLAIPSAESSALPGQRAA